MTAENVLKTLTEVADATTDDLEIDDIAYTADILEDIVNTVNDVGSISDLPAGSVVSNLDGVEEVTAAGHRT